jgi:BirA family transcriptional regulator, biotin operon repressor / biotin---[acetyl-CoA-carboxylase] ligase
MLHPLDCDQIRSFLPKQLKSNHILHMYNSCTSTMDVSQKNPPQQQNLIQVTLAHEQTKGRGQKKKDWLSPKNAGLYLTYARKNINEHRITKLSIWSGIAVFEACAAMGIPKDKMQIKWPNDLLIDGKKVAGILIELTHQGKNSCAHIGIGCNLKQPNKMPQANGLDAYMPNLNPNRLAAQIIERLHTHTTIKTNAQAEKDWQTLSKHDALYQHPLSILSQGVLLEGVSLGIAPTGALILKQTDGSIKHIHDGQLQQHPFKERTDV